MSELKTFIHSMILSIMANTTQEKEASIAEGDSVKEELGSPEKQDVLPRGEKEDVEPRGEREDVQPRGEREDVQPRGEREDVQPRGEREDVQPSGEREDVQLRGEREDVQLRGEKEDVEPKGEKEDVEPKGEKEDVEPKGEKEDVQPKNEKEDVQSRGEEEAEAEAEVKADVEQIKPEAIDEDADEGGGGGDRGGTEEKKEIEGENEEIEENEKEEEEVPKDEEDYEDVPEEDEEVDVIDDELEDDEEEIDEEEDEEADAEEEKMLEGRTEKALDHDQDRRNPQYIPKGGAFYEHDNRTSLEDVENKDPLEVEKKKKVWKESKESERWLHDWYKESEQTPKTKAEIIQTYGYDIRKEEAPPRARRRRKYGRGPDKYERNWEDEQAYMVKQNGPGRKGRRKNFGKDEFPPLPNSNRKNDSSVEKPVMKSQTWKKSEEEPSRNRMSRVSEQERHSTGPPFGRNEGAPHRTNAPPPYSNKKAPPQGSRRVSEEDVKPFRNDKNKWRNNNFRRGKQDEVSKPSKPKPQRQQGEPPICRSVDSNKNSSGDSDVGHLTEGFCQMTFHNKHSSMRDRQNANEIPEQELDSPANRLNPKRYSKNRKSFTGFFPPEDIIEMDPAEIKQLQQEQQQKNQHMNLPQQPLNIQSVIRRYPNTYNGNPGYMATRPIIQGIPNQGMSPQGLQQALSPQGIPQQALSPQVPGLQPIELQQAPLPPQPNFVPPIYIDIDPHYGTSDMMGAYTGYTSYSASQPNEMYQPSGGITYYNTECQNSNQIRPPPARRQKAAIPIVPPSE